MRAKNRAAVLCALVCMASAVAHAQEGAPARGAGRGALPVEDATSAKSAGARERAASAPPTDTEPDENPAARPEVADEPEETEEDRPTGSLPVEDPTLDITTQPDEEAPNEDPTANDTEDAKRDRPRNPKRAEREARRAEAAAEGASDQTDDDGPHKVEATYDGGFLLNVDDWFFLALSGLAQARYTVNYRTAPPIDMATMEPDLDVTQGFDVPRARFTLGIGLTEFVALVMRIGVAAGGDFSFQRAFIDLKWKHFRLRAGLFMNELIAESLVNPWDLYFLDYSIVENVFTPGSSKGVMMTYLQDRYSINLGYSDGLRTGFSEIRSASNADFAITARAQYAWGQVGLTGFNKLNARRGTPFGARIGAAIHYQNGGRTAGSEPVTIALGTVDLAVRGSGWSLLFSSVVGQDVELQTEESQAVLSAGITAMGGYFVLEDLEVFGQYSVVPKPTVTGQEQPDGVNAAASSFHSIGVGASYYVIPNYDNVKVSTDFQYFIGREAGSLVPASPLNGVQANDAGSQFAWRIQITANF